MHLAAVAVQALNRLVEAHHRALGDVGAYRREFLVNHVGNVFDVIELLQWRPDLEHEHFGSPLRTGDRGADEFGSGAVVRMLLLVVRQPAPAVSAHADDPQDPDPGGGGGTGPPTGPTQPLPAA